MEERSACGDHAAGGGADSVGREIHGGACWGDRDWDGGWALAGESFVSRIEPAVPSAAKTFFATDTQVELHFDSPDSGKRVVDDQTIPFARARGWRLLDS